MTIASALRKLRAADVAALDYLALDAIRTKPQTVGAIVKATGIRGQQMSRTLRRLGVLGMIQRSVGKDTRTWVISITAKGLELLEEVG